MIADRAHTRFRGQTGLAARLALRLAPRLVAALAALWIALAVPVAALAQDEPDYASWEQAASRGEDVVEAGSVRLVAVLGGQVADMAVACEDMKIPAQIFLDGLRLGRRFDDDKLHKRAI